MRFLLDENLSPLHARTVRDLGHDAVSVVEIGLSGADDKDVRVAAIEQFLSRGSGGGPGRRRIEIPDETPRTFGPSTGGIGSAGVGGAAERPPTIPELESVKNMIDKALETFEEGYEQRRTLHDKATAEQKKRARWKRDDKALGELRDWLKSRGGLREE